MTPERWQEVSRIFKSAISLDDAARVDYVARQCGVDESLRSEVEKLIDSHKRAESGNFMGGAAVEQVAPLLADGNEARSTERALNKGQQLGSYLVLDRLGAGGMGEVYLAKDSRLDRTVALKVLSQDVASDKRRMQRFRQEAKVASSLNQPNILTIFEFGELDGLTFLSTEYIDGETLRHHLQGKKLKLAETLDIAIQVLAALDAAHDAHIAHRDIKPENVMIRRRDGLVKVLDFGLARVTEKRQTQAVDVSDEAATEFKTAPGMIMGTVNYMSPEQATAKTVDERSDIWSTGVMLYEMLTGELPFTGATSSHMIVNILEKEPVSLAKRAPVPAELERIVLKSMAKNPNERYQTAKDMLIDLRSLKKRLDVQAEIDRTSSPEINLAADDVDRSSDKNGSDKKKVLVLALIAMGVVTATIFAVNVWRSQVRTNTIPSPAPAAVVERSLTYWITVQKFRDGREYQQPFTQPGEMIFEQDYRIRVHIRSPQDGFLYIFNEGPAEGTAQPEYVVVFPSPTTNNGLSEVLAEQVVQIPEKSWLEFDAEKGTEKLWLVFSEQPLPELEAAKGYASERTRMLITIPSVNRDVQEFLNDGSLPRTTSERGDKETTLKAPGKVLVYPIKLEHH